ncbi:MAG TPA: GNAT family N-acetyltransferase [Myxococcota bacterium]
MLTHRGGCHCGAVAFEVDAPPELEVVECNCSICAPSAYRHLIVPHERFRLLRGEEALSTYSFGTHTARHHFCRHCGVKSFYVPRSHPDGFSVNVRCLAPGTVRSIRVRPFDGAHWEEARAALDHPAAPEPGAVSLATTDAEIAACFPVMHELRLKLVASDFVARVRRQQQAGYQLAMLSGAAGPVAVAGFRLSETLAWGRFLYVDDLATLASERSRGHGARLLGWLADYALEHGCEQLHLDSGVQRLDAHRFYQREGLAITSHHFARDLGAKR